LVAFLAAQEIGQLDGFLRFFAGRSQAVVAGGIGLVETALAFRSADDRPAERRRRALDIAAGHPVVGGADRGEAHHAIGSVPELFQGRHLRHVGEVGFHQAFLVELAEELDHLEVVGMEQVAGDDTVDHDRQLVGDVIGTEHRLPHRRVEDVGGQAECIFLAALIGVVFRECF